MTPIETILIGLELVGSAFMVFGGFILGYHGYKFQFTMDRGIAIMITAIGTLIGSLGVISCANLIMLLGGWK